MHTNDFHCNFTRANALKTTVKALREQYPHSLFLDAGDMFESDNPKARLSRGDAVVDFVNELGYDAMTLGDNAFDFFTLDDVERWIMRMRFPVLSANLVNKKTGNPVALPYWIFQCNGIRLAVIGIYDEEPLKSAGIMIVKVKPVLHHYLRKLRGKVDGVIVLSHAGIKKDKKLAEEMEGIDVIIGGSSNTVINEPLLINQTIVVQAGSLGRYVGCLKVRVDLSKNRVIWYEGRLISTSLE